MAAEEWVESQANLPREGSAADRALLVDSIGPNNPAMHQAWVDILEAQEEAVPDRLLGTVPATGAWHCCPISLSENSRAGKAGTNSGHLPLTASRNTF